MQIVHNIENIYAQIGGTTNFPTLLTRTSFGGNPARFDLRRWRIDNGTYTPLKGVQLSDGEALALLHALTAALGDTEQDMTQDAQQPTEIATSTTTDTQTQTQNDEKEGKIQ